MFDEAELKSFNMWQRRIRNPYFGRCFRYSCERFREWCIHVHIQRSANIDAPNLSMGKFRRSIKLGNRFFIEHVQRTKNTVSRGKSKNRATRTWRTKSVSKSVRAYGWSFANPHASLSHSFMSCYEWQRFFVDRTISSARTASRMFRIGLHAFPSSR